MRIMEKSRPYHFDNVRTSLWQTYLCEYSLFPMCAALLESNS